MGAQINDLQRKLLICKESENHAFRFPRSKKPRMDFLRPYQEVKFQISDSRKSGRGNSEGGRWNKKTIAFNFHIPYSSFPIPNIDDFAKSHQCAPCGAPKSMTVNVSH